MHELTLTRPDDWHLHLRDGAMLAAVLPHTAAVFGRAVIMPNLLPPVTTVAQAGAYRDRIIAALAPNTGFTPLMTLYLTGRTTPEELRLAARSGFIHGVKLYPAGATTHSDAGVSHIDPVLPALETLAETGLPLLVHGEATDPAVDVFDREARFIENVLAPLLARLPTLRLVFEHITTDEAVAFVRSHARGVAATITPQHLLYNRNALFKGGLRPHYYCLPVLKAERHRAAVLEAATSGDARFFLGTDSAPHTRSAKESACGCAGVYSAPLALPLYAEAFEQAGRLDRLEAFAAFHGPDFYGLPRNDERMALVREDWAVPDRYPVGGDELIPFRAGETLHWRVAARVPADASS